MEIKKGQIITFSDGEYSDYCVDGLCVALKDFNLDEVVKFWEVENTYSEKCKYRNRVIRRLKDGGVHFISFVVSKGFAEDIDYIEVHTGAYNNFNITIQKK